MRMHIHPKKNAEDTLARLREKRNAELQSQIVKFCKDCQYHLCKYNDSKERIDHGCKHPQLLDIVTGLPTNPYGNRKNESLCGRDGKYWLANPPKAALSDARKV